MLRLSTELSQDAIPYQAGDTYTVYALVTLEPQGNVPRVPMNIALVIDNSGSMYSRDDRIHLALTAAEQAIGMLSPQDVVSVISFSDKAKVMQSAISAGNRDQLVQAVRNVLKSPSAGTHIPKALEAASAELSRNLSRERTNRILLLTDGNTEEADNCVQIATRESDNGISISAFGLGLDWNEHLLKTIADRSRGQWYFINSPQEIGQHFQQEFGTLLATSYSNVSLNLKLYMNDNIRDVKIVSPSIKDVPLHSTGPRQNELAIGAMRHDQSVYVLVTLNLGNRDPGEYSILSAWATYDMMGNPGQQTERVNLETAYVTDYSRILNNGTVLRWVDQMQVDKMVQQATEAAAKGDTVRATRLLTNAQNITSQRGDSKKTQIIGDALKEIGAGGISRKTQLGMRDQARKTQIMPDA